MHINFKVGANYIQHISVQEWTVGLSASGFWASDWLSPFRWIGSPERDTPASLQRHQEQPAPVVVVQSVQANKIQFYCKRIECVAFAKFSLRFIVRCTFRSLDQSIRPVDAKTQSAQQKNVNTYDGETV